MELHVNDLKFGYTKKALVVKGISFSARSGQLISLIGPNGSGKTTIVKCINKILTPQSGSVMLNGKNVQKMPPIEMAKSIAYVPQFTNSYISGSVMDVVMMGRRPYIKWRVTNEDVEIVLKVLQELDLEPLVHEQFEELSGGQKQKILIARALVQNPDLYLFDEPISFLDIKNQMDIMELARNMVVKQNKAVIMVVHDLNMAMRYSDQVILLSSGAVEAAGLPKTVLNHEHIRTVYGVDIRILEESFIAPIYASAVV
ncbi:ATP-binding cassette domain-containing protein [Acetobacterium paludosum]|uniref:ATP-binding cassette domain-containing protein n=1 Tax=Acetobacterium paludosum TaxID=52693 RepID=A0A923KVW5_9FIRM|nr:ABC transporter ATP-binding protein [Acetobacterium paludosum]MBC3887870.1 ATP-binding cassette domain-containing protein [Acetobacterium paludosum]